MIRLATIFLLMSTILQGCATMSENACEVADWRSLGYTDGGNGNSMEKFHKRQQACAKHAITPDRAAYELGRSNGLDDYCVPDTGFDLGESGKRYSGVCTGRAEDQFLAAYDLGKGLFRFNKAVDGANSALADAKKRHAKLDSELNKYRGGYRDEGLSTSEHNEKMLNIWAERRYLQDEAIMYWNYAARYLTEQRDTFEVALATGDPSVAAMRPRNFPGPEKYAGASATDAKDMLREVFSSASR